VAYAEEEARQRKRMRWPSPGKQIAGSPERSAGLAGTCCAALRVSVGVLAGAEEGRYGSEPGYYFFENWV
jgi:hypothetical protein